MKCNLFVAVALGVAACAGAARSAPVRVEAKAGATFDHGGPVAAVLFSPDDEYLLSAGGDDRPEVVRGKSMAGRVRLWKLAKGTKEAGPPPLRDGLLAAALSPDGTSLAVSGGGVLRGPRGRPTVVEPGEMALIDVTGKKKTAPLVGPSFDYRCLAFSPDGKTLAAGGSPQGRRGLDLAAGGPVVLWDVAKGKETATLKGHRGYVQSLAFSSDGKRLASAGRVPPAQGGGAWTGEVKLWDVATGKETASPPAGEGQAWAVAFSPDGKLVASAGDDGVVRLWDVAKGAEFAALKGHRSAVQTLAFSPDGKLLASGGRELKLWDVAARALAKDLPGRESAVQSLRWDFAGKRLATGEAAGAVTVWSVIRR